MRCEYLNACYDDFMDGNDGPYDKINQKYKKIMGKLLLIEVQLYNRPFPPVQSGSSTRD